MVFTFLQEANHGQGDGENDSWAVLYGWHHN